MVVIVPTYTSVGPVSYTHLDVYKRQIELSMILVIVRLSVIHFTDINTKVPA